jgi:hypothetical protein
MLATVPRATSPLTIAADRLRAGQRARAGLRPPTFASPEQEAFFESEAPELLYSGWMGAGKSRILCEKAWSLALHHPGAELGIFRKVRASMPATTERTFWEEVADLRYVVARNRSESGSTSPSPATARRGSGSSGSIRTRRPAPRRRSARSTSTGPASTRRSS